MDLNQGLVSLLFRWRKNRRHQLLESEKELRHSINLIEIKDALTLFASAVFAKPIEIRETEDLPYVSGLKLFLPSFIGVAKGFEKNYEAYQILVLHLFAINKLSPPVTVPDSLENELLKIKELEGKASQILADLYPLYPEKVEGILANLIVAPEDGLTQKTVGFQSKILWGRLPRKVNLIEGSSAESELREALPQRSERKSLKKGSVKKVELDEKENLGEDVFHSFEKIETAEEYKGIQRGTDGEDELAQHADALDELNLEDVIRSSKTAKSLYKTDIDMGFEIADLKDPNVPSTLEKVFLYDEWDEKKQTYKKNWCRIVHSKINENTSGEAATQKSYLSGLKDRKVEIDKLKRQLIQLASEIKIEKKLLSGRNIDIDNVIRNHCMRKSGSHGDQRYYQETKKKHRDLACLLLLDTSLSSDAWVQNRRILDVSLEALLVFGEAAASLGDPIMVAGFHSNTRNDCRFNEWKSFEEPWQRFRTQVDSIVPSGYTRIGPAIRHATELLLQRPEKHKLMLIFTDGRPTDFDRYEGSYGLGDVRQAVREADRQGVVSFAMALDPSAKQFLPRLFGLGNFQILPNIEQLPLALAKFYGKIAKSR